MKSNRLIVSILLLLIVGTSFGCVAMAAALGQQIITAPDTSDQVRWSVIEGWIDHVVTYNLGYLGIAVTIIILTGGFGYYLSVRPLQEKISKQEDQISKQEDQFKKSLRETEKKLGMQFSNLVAIQRAEATTAEEQLKNEIRLIQINTQTEIDKTRTQNQVFNDSLRNDIRDELKSEIINAKKTIDDVEKKATNKIKELERQAQTIELSTIWNEQYVWKFNKFYANELLALTEYLEKALKYDRKELIDLWFTQTNSCLQRIKDNKEKIDDYRMSRLGKVLALLSGFDSKKAEITEVLKELRQ